jgi:hypothetical protein
MIEMQVAGEVASISLHIQWSENQGAYLHSSVELGTCSKYQFIFPSYIIFET